MMSAPTASPSSKEPTGLDTPHGDDYMELVRSMQARAEVDTAAASARDQPQPEDEDQSDNDSDVDCTNSRYIFPGLHFTPSDALRFRLSAWVPRLRSHTMPTRFVELTKEFVEYLQEEGVWMPEEYAPITANSFHGRDEELESDDDSKEYDDPEWKAKVEEIDSSDEEDDEIERQRVARDQLRRSTPFFPSIMSQLSSHLADLGGAIFPSLDYKSPTDATWIMTERIAKCQSVGDILLLIKSSDKIQQELENPFQYCEEDDSTDESEDAGEQVAEKVDQLKLQPSSESSALASTHATAAVDSAASPSVAASASASPSSSFVPTLALRKWSNLHPSKMFRVFVWKHLLLAVSQLDPNYYEFLQKQQLQEDIQDNLEAWLEDDIAPVMTELGLTNYVLDVYIDTHDRCWLVKLKPFWPRATRAVLFSWKEIHEFTKKHDQEEERKQQARLAPPPSSSSSSTEPPVGGYWPSIESTNVPFRVIPSAAAGMDILRTMDSMSTRFPVEGFDVSDSAAIERWIHRVEQGDLKQN